MQKLFRGVLVQRFWTYLDGKSHYNAVGAHGFNDTKRLLEIVVARTDFSYCNISRDRPDEADIPGQKQKDGEATGDPDIPGIGAANRRMGRFAKPGSNAPRSKFQP